MIAPGGLELLRVHLAALETMSSIVELYSKDVAGGVGDPELEGAITRTLDGLERLERIARGNLAVEEERALGPLELRR